MPDSPRISPLFERRLRYCAAGAGAATATIGGAFFVAWICGTMTYRGLRHITIKTNASLCLLLLGVALFLLALVWARRILWLARLLSASSLLIGGLTLAEHLFDYDFGIDQFLAQEAPGALAIMHPNRMGPPGALSFTLGGTGMLLISRGTGKAITGGQIIALLICCLALLEFRIEV